MSPERYYPDEPAGPFPTPPLAFDDRDGRRIEIRAYGDGPGEGFEALVRMYDGFDAADRAQGIPPIREDAIRDWLDRLLVDGAVNLLAWHGERAAGHATLVPDEGGAHELAIFVHQAYQRAGIGSRLIRCLLGEGAERGVGRVWLTVERWNEAAIGLYRDVGFETTDAEGFELEMGLRLR